MVVGNSMDKIFMVMDFMEHDLKGLMNAMKAPFTASEVKRLMYDLTSAIEYCHEHWVLHRDLKTWLAIPIPNPNPNPNLTRCSTATSRRPTCS